VRLDWGRSTFNKRGWVTRLPPRMVFFSHVLRRLEPFWCRGPGLLLASKAWLSTLWTKNLEETTCSTSVTRITTNHSSVSSRRTCFSSSLVLVIAVSCAVVRRYCDCKVSLAPTANTPPSYSDFNHKTSISCRYRTRATCCITANVLQTKVHAQCDKLATELSRQCLRRSPFSSYSDLPKVVNFKLPHLPPPLGVIPFRVLPRSAAKEN